MPEPKKGDKLYTAFNGKLEVVTFFGLTPNGRAYEMLKPARESDDPITGYVDRRFQCAPEMYFRTELAAWEKYYKDCVEAMEPARKGVLEAEDHFRFVQDQVAAAAMKIMHLKPIPDRFVLIVGDDYGQDHYGPFETLTAVEDWIKKNLRGATASLSLQDGRVNIAWNGASPRESVEVRKLGFEFRQTIVRDGH